MGFSIGVRALSETKHYGSASHSTQNSNSEYTERQLRVHRTASTITQNSNLELTEWHSVLRFLYEEPPNSSKYRQFSY